MRAYRSLAVTWLVLLSGCAGTASHAQWEAEQRKAAMALYPADAPRAEIVARMGAPSAHGLINGNYSRKPVAAGGAVFLADDSEMAAARSYDEYLLSRPGVASRIDPFSFFIDRVYYDEQERVAACERWFMD